MQLKYAIPTAIGAVVGTAMLGSYGTQKGMKNGWYQEIRPRIAPPNIVFPIVWSILYLLTIVGFSMALSTENQMMISALIVVNLVMNVLWCFIFFWWQKVVVALFVIIALMGVVWSIVWLSRGHWVLLACFVPLALWVSFAAVLNASAIGRGRGRGSDDFVSQDAVLQDSQDAVLQDSQGAVLNGIEGITSSSPACHFHADAGMVCPVQVKAPLYSVKLYNEVPTFVRETMVAHLRSEWGYEKDFLETAWGAGTGDVMYVMTNNTSGLFIGCVAVDRKNFYPYISQLYVVSDERKHGYGKVLLAVGEEYTKRMGFDTARIWCISDLVPWYQKQGWVVDVEQSIPPKQILMFKTLV